MKRFIASVLSLAASAAFVMPAAFPRAVEGCGDPSYVYGNSAVGGPNESRGEAAAKTAKVNFCKAAALTA